MSERFNLQRFVDAQDRVYPAVVSELSQGLKRSHWMWFVFPQLAGLGHSDMARFYAISSAAEARAYLAHPVLGRRLLECVGLLNRIEGKSIKEILGTPDDLKFRSSMTLFAQIALEEPSFKAALDKYCEGRPDPLTQDRLRTAI